MQKRKRPIGDALVMVLQFGFNMIVPIGIMSVLGWWIGEKTGMSWMMIPFFFVGAVAGGNSIYRMSKKYLGPGKKSSEKKGKSESDGKTSKME